MAAGQLQRHSKCAFEKKPLPNNGFFTFLLKTHGLGFHEIPTHYQIRPRHTELLRQITYHHERIQNMLGNIPIFV
jgi:hypothetical protein